MINSGPSCPSELFPTKYVGVGDRGHIFAPKHENGEFDESFESFNELFPIYLKSLDELDQYIITEESGEWFEEHLIQKQNKTHFPVKSGCRFDFVLPINSILTSKDDLGRFKQFVKLLSLPNDTLPPIWVQKHGEKYIVANGHHRLEYSIQKGYTHIPVYVD
jgi:hypothetical protein